MTRQDREDFGLLVLALREAPKEHGRTSFEIVKDAERLSRLAKRHHRLAELGCNGMMTEPQTTEEQRIEEDAAKILAVYGFTLRAEGDPRGFTLKIGSESAEYWHGPRGFAGNAYVPFEASR